MLPTSGDGTIKVQPASDLFWLSGIEPEESVLVLRPQASDPGAREILFVRQLNGNEHERLAQGSSIATCGWPES